MILIPESGYDVVKSQGHLGNAGLNNTIEQLLETIPEGVPAKDTIIEMGNRAPLRMRIQANPDGPNLLKLNIRTYGVLVDDPSRHGAFQFAHKSFFEYLVGAYYASKLAAR